RRREADGQAGVWPRRRSGKRRHAARTAVGILGVTTNQLLLARTLASLQGARTKEGFRQWVYTIPVKAPTACGTSRAMLLNGWQIGSRKTLCAATCGIRKGRRVAKKR